MHLTTYAVAGEFFYHTVAVLFAMILHGGANITDTTPRECCLDTFIEALLRDTKQLLDFVAHISHAESVGGVATKSVEESSTVDGNDVAITKLAIIRQAVYHTFVDRGTDATRERFGSGNVGGKTFEGGRGTMITNVLLGQGVQLFNGHARLHNFGDLGQCCAYQTIGCAQQVDFFFCLQIDHPSGILLSLVI